MEPKVTIPNEETEVEKVIGGQSDLAYTLALEVLPKIELADFKGIKLERLAAEVTDAEIDEALDKIAEQNRPFAAKGEGGKVEKGDRVVDRLHRQARGRAVRGRHRRRRRRQCRLRHLHSGLRGSAHRHGAGETRQVKVTFPGNYMNAQLAGKDAEFDVTAKTVEAPAAVTVDDDFAKPLGLESLDKLKEAVKERIAQEHAGLSRQKVKRQLLDKLDEMHKFALPPTLVEEEFKNVWNAVDSDLKAPGPHL